MLVSFVYFLPATTPSSSALSYESQRFRIFKVTTRMKFSWGADKQDLFNNLELLPLVIIFFLLVTSMCDFVGWCCKEKLDASHNKSREEKMAGGNKWLWIQVKYFSLKGSHYIIICFLFNHHYNCNCHCYFQYYQLK